MESMEILANNGPGLIGLILIGYFIYRNYKAPMAGNYANTVIFALVLLFGFALPILGMMNCSGWNEGSGAVYSCLFLDSGFTRAYANFYYGLLLLSAFALLIPFVIYAYLVVGLGNYLSKKDAVGLGNLSVWGGAFSDSFSFYPGIDFSCCYIYCSCWRFG